MSSLLLTPIMLSGFISCTSEKAEVPKSTDKTTVEVAAVANNLKRGDIITAKDVTTVNIEPSAIPENYLPKRSDAIGRVLLTDVSAGDILSDDILVEKADPNVLKQDDVYKIKKEFNVKFPYDKPILTFIKSQS